jgi:hypothetical protein
MTVARQCGKEKIRSSYLMSAVLFFKDAKVLEISCTIWMHLTLEKCRLQKSKDGKFYMYFATIFLKEKIKTEHKRTERKNKKLFLAQAGGMYCTTSRTLELGYWDLTFDYCKSSFTKFVPCFINSVRWKLCISHCYQLMDSWITCSTPTRK